MYTKIKNLKSNLIIKNFPQFLIFNEFTLLMNYTKILPLPFSCGIFYYDFTSFSKQASTNRIENFHILMLLDCNLSDFCKQLNIFVAQT